MNTFLEVSCIDFLFHSYFLAPPLEVIDESGRVARRFFASLSGMNLNDKTVWEKSKHPNMGFEDAGDIAKLTTHVGVFEMLFYVLMKWKTSKRLCHRSRYFMDNAMSALSDFVLKMKK